MLSKYILYVKVLPYTTRDSPDVSYVRTELINLYREKINKMETSEYLNNPHKDSGFDLYLPNDMGNINSRQVGLIDMCVQCAAYRGVGVNDDGTSNLEPCPYYMYARSSLPKKGLLLANSTGIIDSGYRGNLKAFVHNYTDNDITFGTDKTTIKEYDRLVQLCSPDLTPFTVKLVDSLDNTARGSGGFGSTGN